MTILLVILCLLGFLLFLPLIAEALRVPMTPRLQEKAPGEIAHLPKGATHFRWSGPEDGPIALCIHGLSTPSYVFAATENSLAALGFRVLSYDLYGRGYSARPGGAQTADFFLAQLRHLLTHQEVTGPITILGFSMGGQIAASLAARDPKRVAALILVAPAGLTPKETDDRSPLWQMPWIGGWLTRVAGGIVLRRELIEHRTTPSVIPDLEDRQAAETRTRGFLPAILSSRRHLLSRSGAEDHASIAKSGIPVLAIWAAEDPVIPLSDMGRLARINPEARHAQIPGAGHSLLQTHPAQVAEALRKFTESLPRVPSG